MKRERIIEFLRDCPLYTRLYSPLYGYCEFLECSRNFIFVRASKSDPKHNKCGDIVYKFNEIGQPAGTVHEDNEIAYSECMLFPSHTHKSWKNWQEHLFKDGDIIIHKDYAFLDIDIPPSQPMLEHLFKVEIGGAPYLRCQKINGDKIFITRDDLKNYRYATDEEMRIFINRLVENSRQQEKVNTKVPDKMFHTDDIIIDRTIGIGYLHLFRVDGYNSAGRCWFCYDSNGTRYALTQDEINKYEYATEQEITDFKELQDKFEKE